MELALIIYLIEFLSIKHWLLIASMLTIVAYLLFRGVCVTEAYPEEEKRKERERFDSIWDRIKRAVVFTLVLGAALPSSATAYKMLAAYAGMEVAQMEETKQVGSKAYAALNKVLDEYLQEEKAE